MRRTAAGPDRERHTHDRAFPGDTPGPPAQDDRTQDETQGRTQDGTQGRTRDRTQDHLTHLDEAGAARMVDVSGKDVTARTARATGRVLVSPRVVELLRGEGVPKGDALATARIAGIMGGAKRTPDRSRRATLSPSPV
ncbi:Cyclic pyranopterin monophosphate synthase [Streptomyces hirsutus]